MSEDRHQNPRWLLSFPFPLENGELAELRLPREGLTPVEAERLKIYIDSLVVEPKP